MSFKSCFVLALTVVGLLMAMVPTALAQTNRVTFPADFDQMVLYGDYIRGSSGEMAYARPETIAAAKAGLPLPPGTQLVLENLW
ncbi:MAG: hypothetical protein ABL962_15735 [Fimbriimonadaceae bacterium]